MKIGIAADHGGYEMKQKIYILLNAKGHQLVDFGNFQYDRSDDYPDFAIPLARAAQTESWNVVSCSVAVA
jgi:ribose 5-phosphate isomerase B